MSPFGDLTADSARGLFMGNRGGRFHRDDRTLGERRWASRQWICCLLRFKARQRRVWSEGYTELFFLDEVTALAAGHRPCFECRRADALAFSQAWESARGHKPHAAEMDAVLHGERLNGRGKRLHTGRIDDLPDAAMVVFEGGAYALRRDRLLRWTVQGYAERLRRPQRIDMDVLTPPSIVAALAAGYRPQWHASAGTA